MNGQWQAALGEEGKCTVTAQSNEMSTFELFPKDNGGVGECKLGH